MINYLIPTEENTNEKNIKKSRRFLTQKYLFQLPKHRNRNPKAGVKLTEVEFKIFWFSFVSMLIVVNNKLVNYS